MFINCRHCHALVATDPATDLPPERCPRCRGVLRRPDAAVPAGPDQASATPALTPAAPPPPAPVRDARAPATGIEPSPAADVGLDAKADTDVGTGSGAGAGAGAGAEVIADVTANGDSDGEADGQVGDNAGTGDRSRDGHGDGDSDTEVAAAAPVGTADAEAVALPDAPEHPADAASSDGPDETPAPASDHGGPAFAAGAGEAAAQPTARRKRAWSAAAIAALAALLALQILLADRERLAADPGWRPVVASACGLLGCELPPWREPSAIVLVSRDVRPHPSRAQALQVRASFRNDARWPQAWPRLLLTLSDVDGRAVAARAFEPHEYLGAAPTARFAPGQTAEIALDIREPAAATVSYAFDFRP